MPRKIRSSNRQQEAINAPIVEVFGGAFALLMILFLIINTIADTELYAMLDDAVEESAYKVSWETGAEGFVIIAFPDRLHILQSNTTVPQAQICDENQPFISYVRQLYQNLNQQVIFTITEGGVRTMAIARNCMLAKLGHMKLTIGWIIANQQLLRVVGLDEIPVEIKQAIKKTIESEE